MELSIREAGEVHIVDVAGRLNIGPTSEQLNAALTKIAEQGGKRVVLNLDGVVQIDSSGISVLVRHMNSLAREGGAMRLICGAGRVRDALTVTRLVEAIPTFDSEAAALAGFS